MPGPAHEIVITTLKERPALLDELLRALGHPSLGPRVVVDGTLRMVDPVEAHPDAVLANPTDPGDWTMLEVQRSDEPDRGRRWLVAAALLLNEKKRMGDVVVITHSRAVARWSRRVASFVSRAGTRLTLRPIVVQLTVDDVDRLLASPHPELAVFAAWVVHERRGSKAQAIVERAIGRADDTSNPTLRVALVRSILNVLDPKLLASLREKLMDPNSIPESPAFREMRLELEARGEARGKALGEARGEAKALLLMLESRGVVVDRASREKITNSTDTVQLERWIRRALSIARIDELFSGRVAATKAKRAAANKHPAKGSSARSKAARR